MDICINIILLLLWVCESRATPTPQSPPPVRPLSSSRSSSGWSQNRTVSTDGGSRIVFPAHHPSNSPAAVTPDVTLTRIGGISPQLSPNCKKNGRFCNATNYPKDFIDKLLRDSGLVERGVFNVNEAEYKEEEEDDLVIRQGVASKEFDLCPSVVDANPQNTGVDKEGKERFIINQENVTQLIRQNRCESVETPCKLNTFPSNYVVQCRQKYIDRKFAALNDRNEIEWMLFPTPSCCVCSFYSKRSTRSLFTPANRSYLNDLN